MSAPDVAVVFPQAHQRGGVERIAWDLCHHLVRQGRQVAFVGEGMAGGADAEIRQVVVQPRAALPRPVAFRLAATSALASLAPRNTITLGANCPPGDICMVQSVHRSWLASARTVPVAGRTCLPRCGTSCRGTSCCSAWSRRTSAAAARGPSCAAPAASPRRAPPLRRADGPAARSAQRLRPGRLQRGTPGRARRRCARRMGATPDDVVLLLMANELHRKGFGPLVQAVAEVADPRLRVAVVGKADPRRTRRSCSGSGSATASGGTGPTDDAAAWYAAADLLTLPTQYEPFGLVIVEALATGLPVLTTRLAGRVGRGPAGRQRAPAGRPVRRARAGGSAAPGARPRRPRALAHRRERERRALPAPARVRAGRGAPALRGQGAGGRRPRSLYGARMDGAAVSAALLAVARSPLARDERAARLCAAADPVQLLEAAQFHRLEQAVHLHVKDDVHVDAALRHAVKQADVAQVVQTMRVRADLQRLASVLGAADVPHLVIKGIVLADTLYARSPSVRAYTDVDVVVRPEDRVRAVTAVLDGGGVALSRPAELVRDDIAQVSLRLTARERARPALAPVLPAVRPQPPSPGTCARASPWHARARGRAGGPARSTPWTPCCTSPPTRRCPAVRGSGGSSTWRSRRSAWTTGPSSWRRAHRRQLGPGDRGDAGPAAPHAGHGPAPALLPRAGAPLGLAARSPPQPTGPGRRQSARSGSWSWRRLYRSTRHGLLPSLRVMGPELADRLQHRLRVPMHGDVDGAVPSADPRGDLLSAVAQVEVQQ